MPLACSRPSRAVSIPAEILLAIAPFLRQEMAGCWVKETDIHLTQAIRVCRFWYETLLPVLWQTVLLHQKSVSPSPGSLSPESLQKHAHLIQNLTDGGTTSLFWHLLPRFPTLEPPVLNLTSLRVNMVSEMLLQVVKLSTHSLISFLYYSMGENSDEERGRYKDFRWVHLAEPEEAHDGHLARITEDGGDGRHDDGMGGARPAMEPRQRRLTKQQILGELLVCLEATDHLSELTLTGYPLVLRYGWRPVFWRLCLKLQMLRVANVQWTDPYPWERDVPKVALEKMEAGTCCAGWGGSPLSRLKVLSVLIDRHPRRYAGWEADLVTGAENLEDLKWKSSIQLMKDTAVFGPWSSRYGHQSLGYLTRLGLRRVPIPDVDLMSILSNLPWIVKLNLVGTDASQWTIRHLVECKPKLKELHLSGCQGVSSLMIQELLCTLQYLEIFRAEGLLVVDILGADYKNPGQKPGQLQEEGEQKAPLSNFIGKQWVCKDVRELELSVDGFVTLGVRQHDAAAMAGWENVGLVYQRLSQFHWLRKLRLAENRAHEGEHWMDFTLEHGLEQLAGLQSLQALDVQGLRTKVKEEDLSWMLRNWPNLRDIFGKLDQVRAEDIKLTDYLAVARPYVRRVVDYDW